MARRASPRFDPSSLDATLATIISELRAHRKEVCERFDGQDQELHVIKEQALKTNGRVNLLELWRETSKAKMAGIAAGLGACGGVFTWLAGILLKSS